MTDLLNPLGPEALGQITAALADLEVVDKAISKAERAGIDVAGLKEEAEHARSKLAALKQVYFPNS